MKKWIVNFAILFIGAFIFPCEKSQATAGDYDGDGLADLAIIDADEPEKKTTVFVRRSSNGSVKSFVFHPFGDRVISGSFFGDGLTYPGIVSAVRKGKSKPLEWRIKTPSGKENVFRFGVKGDKVPNQGDLDCDGKTDFVLVSNGSGGTRVWQAKMSSNPGTTQSTTFGSTGDLIYTSDINGDGCSEIVTLNSGFQWTSRSFSGGDTTTFQAGLPGDIPMLPADIDGDGIIDYLTSRIDGNNQVAHLHSPTVAERTSLMGSSGSIPMVGNFFGQNTFGWFERARGRFVLTNLDQSLSELSFGNPRRGLLRPDGTDVIEGENGRFGKSGSSNSGSDSGSDSEIECDSQLKKDGSGGFKNNPENSKNTIKIIFPNSMTGKINSVSAYSGNDKFDTLKFHSGNEWGNRERYYGRKALSSYPKNLLIVAAMKNGSNICAILPDPKKVLD